MLTCFKRFADGVAAGVLVSIGGCVFLACESKPLGAVLFSVALLCICYKSYSLYTGKVGYIVHSHGKSDFAVLFLGLLGNFVGAVFSAAVALLAGLDKVFANAPAAVAAAKLAQAPWETLLRAFLCGILMYLAVSIFKDGKSPIGVLFCIPVFILSGFEHSIADMFYLSVGATVSADYILRALLFALLAVIGNSLGALFIALFVKLKKGAA